MDISPNFDAGALAALCAADGEFRIAARYWTGGFRLNGGAALVALRLDEGEVAASDPGSATQGVITLSAPPDIWAQLTSARPPRFFNDIATLIGAGAMMLEGDAIVFAQYYPAIMRAIELLRPSEPNASATQPAKVASGSFDSPVGRYIHLDVENQDHRIYFEEAGSGIPLLLQHTAGCHGSQWRHLFEYRESPIIFV